MINQRRGLEDLITKDLMFHQEAVSKMSGLFLDFIEGSRGVFTYSGEFQYVLVPKNCHEEFKTHLKTQDRDEHIYNDAHHFHYIDPKMTPSFHRFCQIHQITPMFHRIQKHPIYKRLPVGVVIEEIRKDLVPEQYFNLVIDCLEPSGLSFVLPMTTNKRSIYIANLLLKYQEKPPCFINNIFITNWLVQQGCPLEMLTTMWDNGFPIRFPLKVEDQHQKLCGINEKIIEWCFQKCCGVWPFNITIDHIIMNPFYMDDEHFPFIYHALKNGHPPSKTAFSILLKKTNLKNKDLYFKDYVIQKLKNNGFDEEMWTETRWQANQDELITFILEFCNEDVVWKCVIVHLCMNRIDVLYADMDYWVLKIGHLYSCTQFAHLVRFHRDGETRVIDQRIIKHLQQRKRQMPPTDPRTYPPFYEKHHQTIIFHDNQNKKIEIPVYVSFLQSGLLDKIINPGGFKKPVNTDGGGVIQLDLGLPDIFKDQKKVMCDWIMFSYIQEIPSYCSVDDVIEMHHLSQYLIDEGCMKQTTKWLDNQYIIDYETHMKHPDSKKQECLLCSFWHR